MPIVAVTNGRLVTPDKLIDQGTVLIENGRISACGEASAIAIPEGAQIIDANGLFIGPGFVDIHCHGGGGVWSFDDPSTYARAHLAYGTTSILPTLVYNQSEEDTIAGVARIAEVIETSGDPLDKAIAGIHMEGPYINKKYGAIIAPIRPPNPREYNEVLRIAGKHIKVWTLAPELEGQQEFVEAASPYGIAFSVGHSEATAEQIFNFVPHGLRIGCHCTNASGTTPSPSRMPGTREIGVDEAVLVHDDIYAEVIPDELGIHVRPLMLKLIHKTKGTDRVIIITDAMPQAGAPKERAEDESSAVPEGAIERFGTYRGEPDLNFDMLGQLSGSRLTMDKAVRNMIDHAGIDMVAAFRMAALNPATVIRMQDEIGSIEPGKRANIVIVDPHIRVDKVLLDGALVYETVAVEVAQ